jgi:ubiquinone/menaquinone biosynthesis C-methylase UbiE
LIPNLHVLFIIGLVYRDAITSPVTNMLMKLREITEKYEVWSHSIVKKIEPDDLIKPDFSEKIGSDIAEGMPFHSDEALLGEDWIMDIAERRRRALRAIQDKVNPKAGKRFIVRSIWPDTNMHEFLSRDDELRKWLDPEKLLISYGLEEGAVFVDMGCFEGLFTIAAAKIVGTEGRVYGIDLSSSSIEKIKSYADENGLRNIMLKEDFPEKVQLERKIADFVFFGTTLSDSYDPVKSLKNAHAILKDSGRLVVLEWKEGDLDAGPTYHSKLARQKIVAYAESAGFIIKTVTDEGNYHYSAIAVKKSV